MLKILTIAQTRQVEAEANASGYTYAQMMADAGAAAAQRALALLEGRPDVKITLLVGAGNNGGDGLVAGVHLAQALGTNGLVRFYLLTQRDSDSDAVFKAVVDAGLFVACAEHDTDGRVLRHMVASADLVIDALFGIGARLPLRDAPARVLRLARQAIADRARETHTPQVIYPSAADTQPTVKPLVLAIDCPSGLDCDSGALDSVGLAADETVTFIAAKPGLLTFPGAAAVGRLWVAPLDMSNRVQSPTLEQARAILLDSAAVREMLPPRPVNAHKGTFGRAMIVGGSGEYTGAVGLSARAAYASGAGLVTVAAPSHVTNALTGHLLEATWRALPDSEGALSPDGMTALKALLQQSQTLLVGPGMGRAVTTRAFLEAMLAMPLPPLVLDADALNLLTELESWPSRLPAETILTPHPGEMARLCGTTPAELPNNRSALAAQKAQEWRAVVVLKGAHTVIASPEGRVAISPFKNAALAKGGTGDVLAGLMTGLRAQGMGAFEAACAAVYIHGLAGEIALQNTSSRSILAGDIAAGISAALMRIERP